MDPARTSQLVSWLDEELRRQKAQISDLRDLLQKQSIELGDQRKRNEDLQTRLTRLQTDLARVPQVDQAIQQVKDELAAVLKGVREEVRRADQQALQARQMERESEAKAYIELSQRVERLATMADRLTSATTELQRLNEVATNLRQRLDVQDKETIRRADRETLAAEEHKRDMERLHVMQQALDGIRTQMESYAARFQYLERWAQGSAQRTADLQAFRVDIQRTQSEIQEGQRRSEQRVERQIREWSTVEERIRRDQEVWANQLRIFAEQHERTKKALVSIQDLTKEVRLAQDESRQALDVDMEKQRRELREWQGENEKRWTRYLAQWEYRWNEQRKANSELTARIEDLEAAKVPLDKELQELRAALAEQEAAARAAVMELWRFHEDYMQRQLDVTNAAADKLHTQIGQQEIGRAPTTRSNS